MKRNAKKVLLLVLSLLLAAAIGIAIYLSSGPTGDPVKVFSFYNIGMTEYWGDSQESYGYVQTDKVQTVFLSTTQTVTEILVSQGDQVKKGDVLMTFDTTLSDLSVERKRLDVEKRKLQLEEANAELKRINSMKPMVIPDPPKETEPNLGTALTTPYKISTKAAYDGSSSGKAMICWLSSGTAISDEIFSALKEQATILQNLNVKAPSSASAPSDPTENTTDPTDSPTETPTEAPTEAPNPMMTMMSPQNPPIRSLLIPILPLRILLNPTLLIRSLLIRSPLNRNPLLLTGSMWYSRLPAVTCPWATVWSGRVHRSSVIQTAAIVLSSLMPLPFPTTWLPQLTLL